jgi:hypothetical protein
VTTGSGDSFANGDEIRRHTTRPCPEGLLIRCVGFEDEVHKGDSPQNFVQLLTGAVGSARTNPQRKATADERARQGSIAAESVHDPSRSWDANTLNRTKKLRLISNLVKNHWQVEVVSELQLGFKQLDLSRERCPAELVEAELT